MGRLAVAGLLASVLGGCSLVYGSDLDAKQCTKQEDCDSASASVGTPLVCEANVCRQPSCASSVDCPTGTLCVSALCVSPDAGTPALPCNQDSDCAGTQLCGYDKLCYEKWACLDNDRDWTANTSGTYRAYVRNFGTSTPVTGTVTGKACAPSDSDCKTPVVPAATVDPAQQLVSVLFSTLPRDGFTGTVNIDVDAGVVPPPPDGGYSSAYYPGVVQFTSQNPMVSDLSPQTDILLTSPSLVSAIAKPWFDAKRIPYPVDPVAALTVLQVHDCGGRKAAGMKLTPRATPETATWLFVPIESKTSPNPDLTKTTEDGAALLFNLPGGPVTFTLTDEDQNKVINDRIAMTLKAPAINYFAYYPRRAAVEKWMTYAKSQGLLPQ